MHIKHAKCAFLGRLHRPLYLKVARKLLSRVKFNYLLFSRFGAVAIYTMAKFIIHVMVLVVTKYLFAMAYMKSVRVEDIPFGIEHAELSNLNSSPENNMHIMNLNSNKGIQISSRLEKPRNFIHLFKVPYIVCFFAAKGKWPFIPPFMQSRVDNAAKSIFSHNDSYIKQFCQKWIKITECFRPLFATTSDVEVLPARSTACTCANFMAEDSVAYLDKNYLGNVNTETIQNTIEFLQNFLPAPTRKIKKKIHVRGRVDEINID